MVIMANRKCEMFVVFLIIAMLSTIVMPINNQKTNNCAKFSSIMRKVRRLVECDSSYNLFLERLGFVQSSSIFGTNSTDKQLDTQLKNAKALTIAAQIFKSEFNIYSNNFEMMAQECMKDQLRSNRKVTNVHPKYRSIDGRGNNIKYPEWGASDTPFAHYGPKNYEDGIYKIKKSVTGSDLPNARLVVQEIPLKFVVVPKNGKIGCINMVRSQLGKLTSSVEAGEIMNSATSYLDLSLIYGNHVSELKSIRLYKDGKLRMGNNNVLPVDSNGKYLQSMNRFVLTPVASILPAIFSRNHNYLAVGLGKLNPHWDDETVFQEARRINIANFQYNLITAKSIERVFNKVVNASYSSETNVATSVEFAFSYRSGHYYTPTHFLLQDENFTETKYLQSDTIGKIELLEDAFDDALRAATNQRVNVDQFSDEMINRIGKNDGGFGIDLVATYIQRGRDHGLPSFVEIRRKCKLSPEINSLDEFSKIFNKTNVELLKRMYNSHEDVDFYVGGLLETFETLANPYVGPTFGCVIGENYNNVMGGDVYFFSHPENPYPFTKAQIDSISKYSFPNIFCTNSELKETNKIWPYAPNPTNPKVSCKKYPPMDLSPWKE